MSAGGPAPGGAYAAPDTHVSDVAIDRAEVLLVARDAELSGEPERAAEIRAALGPINQHSVEDLLGRTMRSVTRNGNASIDFEATTGECWSMYYARDCCAECTIEDVAGELQDLVGAPIALAEESTNSDDPRPPRDYPDESYTWTFYRFATVKGYVTIRWYGSSNGYYSETASFARMP